RESIKGVENSGSVVNSTGKKIDIVDKKNSEFCLSIFASTSK
ncbi:29030_t:CDS:1, partial [Racocetra persica]